MFFSDMSDGKRVVLALSLFILSLTLLLFVKRQVWKRLEVLTANSSRGWDRALVQHLSRPVQWLLWIIAILFSLQCLPPEYRSHPSFIVITKSAFILMFALMANTGLTVAIRHWHAGGAAGESARILLTNLARLGLVSLTALIILDTVGISITPILASLGVGSLAVALALQDTLSNFFSGIHILIDKPVRVGDLVRLDNNQEGVIKDIGWRSTHIRLGSNNTLVIPNSKLSSSIITNFSLPFQETSFSVKVGVSYESDLANVERVTIEVGQQVLANTPGAVADFEPVVRFENFGESSIDFTVGLKASRYQDLSLVRHELIKALHARFSREGISIPFPQRVVHLAPGESLPRRENT